MVHGLRRALSIAFLGFWVLSAAAVQAVPLIAGAELRGQPVTQRFLGGDTSVIASPLGLACVAGAVIDVAQSVYAEPDGAETPFEQITRSRAASLQFIAPVDGSAVFARIQLKFSVGRGPVTLSVGEGFSQDIGRFVEPSTDSFRIDDPEIVAALRRAADGEVSATLVTPSRDTGRVVTDRVPPIAFIGFDACRDALPHMPEAALPTPGGLLHIVYQAEPTPDTRATPAETRVCGVVDPEIRLYRGRLRALSGFTTPDDRVFVEFDSAGTVRRLHIPGLLDATRDAAPTGARAGSDYAARLSVSADGNDPLAENTVTGCLGLAPTPLCDIDGVSHPAAFPLMQPEGVRSAGYCIGALAAAEFGDEAFVSDPFDPAGTGARQAGDVWGTGAGVVAGGASGFGFGFGGGSAGGGGGSGAGTSNGDLSRITPEQFPTVTPPPPPIVIAAPPTIWLMLAAALALATLRAADPRRRRLDASARPR